MEPFLGLTDNIVSVGSHWELGPLTLILQHSGRRHKLTPRGEQTLVSEVQLKTGEGVGGIK